MGNVRDDLVAAVRIDTVADNEEEDSLDDYDTQDDHLAAAPDNTDDDPYCHPRTLARPVHEHFRTIDAFALDASRPCTSCVAITNVSSCLVQHRDRQAPRPSRRPCVYHSLRHLLPPPWSCWQRLHQHESYPTLTLQD